MRILKFILALLTMLMLLAALCLKKSEECGAAADISGMWNVTFDYKHGRDIWVCSMEQDGCSIIMQKGWVSFVGAISNATVKIMGPGNVGMMRVRLMIDDTSRPITMSGEWTEFREASVFETGLVSAVRMVNH